MVLAASWDCGSGREHQDDNDKRQACAKLLDQEMPGLGRMPRLKLSAAEFANLLPAIGVTLYEYDVGLRPGGRSRGVRLGGVLSLQAVQVIIPRSLGAEA